MTNNFSHHHDTWRTPVSWCQCQHSISRECWGYTECGQLGRLQQSLQTEAGLHSLVLAPRECWTVGTPVCHHDGVWIHSSWHQCGIRRPWLWNRYIPTMHVYVIDLHGCVSQSRERHLVYIWSMCHWCNHWSTNYVTDTFSQYCILETTTASPQNSVCNVAPEDRRECGYAGIGEADCLERGCCYDDSIPGTIWCFQKKGQEWKHNAEN